MFQRRQGPPQLRKFWGFMNCFSDVFWHLLNQKKKKNSQRKSSTLKHAVVNKKKF